jgi:hypothetical protein
MSMLNKEDIHRVIDDASREIAQEYPKESGHVASLGARLKFLLRSNMEISSPAELFEMCSTIDDDRRFRPSPKIAKIINTKRLEAKKVLLALFFSQENADNNEQRVRMQREYKLALCIGEWLPQFQKNKPHGKFGPAWLKENCDNDFWQAILWHVYDAQDREDHWNRFSALLPSDVRRQFDPSLTPMEDVPDSIRDEEHALELLVELARHRNTSLQDITDPDVFAELYRTEPAFRKVMDYFNQ